MKKAFLGLFALATNKAGVVSDFRSWCDDKWRWQLGLRRPLFDWERDQWKGFMLALDYVAVRQSIPDNLAWMFNVDGMFSVCSFRLSLEGQPFVEREKVGLLWKIVCPPKVQIFMWQLVKGRVLVKDLLYIFGMRSVTNRKCPIYLKENEIVDHLFLHYG